jgi:hypothetical protein
MVKKVKSLNNYSLIHNSGLELWEYLFEGQKLKNFEECEDDAEWFEEGKEWMKQQLLQGEIFEIYEENNVYAYTNYGRVANIKRKSFKKITKQSHTFQVNFSGGAISLTKMIKEAFGIILNMDDMPEEIRHLVHVTDRTLNPIGSVGRPRKYKTYKRTNNEQEDGTNPR